MKGKEELASVPADLHQKKKRRERPAVVTNGQVPKKKKKNFIASTEKKRSAPCTWMSMRKEETGWPLYRETRLFRFQKKVTGFL